MNTIPKIDIVPSPTPLEYLAGVSEDLGVHFYIKREDMTGLGVGGNKLRKLQYLLADAKAQGATMLLTVGGAQTNHGRLTAAVAAKYGMKCAIVSEDVYPGEISSNILLDRIMGISIEYRPGGTDMQAAIEEVGERLRGQGGKPYVIPGGGSNQVGALGYAAVAFELVQQANEQALVIDHRQIPDLLLLHDVYRMDKGIARLDGHGRKDRMVERVIHEERGERLLHLEQLAANVTVREDAQ
jgi:1-aminocyclopropane-1-carboxylate deaminase/D-cysteine desulfhydrase-like pyridoxal-dependent ACC family enzyme